MKIPKALRKQILEYKKFGFNVIDAEHRSGSHWFITFAEFPQKQLVTQNANEPRSIKNNVASYKRILKGQS